MHQEEELELAPLDEQAWAVWKDRWQLRGDTTYLNHGSFGLIAKETQEAQRDWQSRMACQPMDFYVRELEDAWIEARDRVAHFVGTPPQNLAFCENATDGMNTVARSFKLSPGDEVLLTDHEYGAVRRIWTRACEEALTNPPEYVTLPQQFDDPGAVVSAIFSAVTPKTKLLVVSHISSPGGIILPIEDICRQANEQGLCICIDGPHAPAQVPLNLDELHCDYYTASLHKWLSAPLGSGFLYVAPQHQEQIIPPLLSWGRLLPARPEAWWQEFIWPGTRDPSPYLAAPTAIQVLERIGLEQFRARTHTLAQYARQQLVDFLGTQPAAADRSAWYGSMTNVPLPPGDHSQLQRELWKRFRIEVPIVNHLDRWTIRVSCHVYNGRQDVDYLMDALRQLL